MQTFRSRKPATYILLLAASSLIACSEDGGSGVPISWSLNYGDWTQTTPEFKARGCDNQPSDYTANPPYPEIDAILFEARDPLGQVPPQNRRYDCAQGLAPETQTITLNANRLLTVTMQAVAADGTVLYQHQEPVDFEGAVTDFNWQLDTQVSETTFSATFGTGSESLLCPDGTASLRWHLLYRPQDIDEPAEGEDAVDPEVPFLSGEETNACDAVSGIVNDLKLRNIPITPELGSNGGYIPTIYRLRVEAIDGSGNITHCGEDGNRTFRPGENRDVSNADIPMNTGSCN